ncbi:class I SAM-dependent methyltransferase [Sinomonas sp. ASV322]|uniref:class I SAM-dependent DNA methyltransferase n=1 Tax=Sinomonas sp. ASV322 TaxID=3041920 RepID=UPI0027DBD201|nr:class I SAM-dependent methyltransferase [Sinomonas sp. ASV322]MDQ4503882.1 class I SAM-dependent methyltransferase [Sinomonas sp. ASV322]
MAETEVRDAYSRRAAEYAELFGAVDKAHEQDQGLIAQWAMTVRGPVLDAGCGPGHWTAFLHDRGLEVEGVDLTPSFIEHARTHFPGVRFRVVSFADLGVQRGLFGGILSWYSLIHIPPDDLESVLRVFGRCISLGGTLLVGFFEGPDGEAFPHAVTTAYYWSADGMSSHLARAGFEVVGIQGRTDPGHRPHAAMVARRLPDEGE